MKRRTNDQTRQMADIVLKDTEVLRDKAMAHYKSGHETPKSKRLPKASKTSIYESIQTLHEIMARQPFREAGMLLAKYLNRCEDITKAGVLCTVIEAPECFGLEEVYDVFLDCLVRVNNPDAALPGQALDTVRASYKNAAEGYLAYARYCRKDEQFLRDNVDQEIHGSVQPIEEIVAICCRRVIVCARKAKVKLGDIGTSTRELRKIRRHFGVWK